jgi:hypothetical protein
MYSGVFNRSFCCGIDYIQSFVVCPNEYLANRRKKIYVRMALNWSAYRIFNSPSKTEYAAFKLSHYKAGKK